MKTYRKIVLALGLRENEDEVLLKRAVDFAAAFQAEILLLHVVAVDHAYALPYAKSKLQQLQTLRVREARRQMQILGERFGIPVSNQWIVEGPVEHSVLSMACQFAADLIIVGQPERHHLAEVLLGSVTNNIVKQAPCDVLTWRF